MKNSIFVEPQHFIDLFEYDGWASDRILSALSTHITPQHDRALDLMSHLLRSQAVWLGRVDKTEAAQTLLWERDSLETCMQHRQENTVGWLKFLRACAAGDFATQVTYTNTKGETYTSGLREILTHVVNHGTHHRAQISSLLRAGGIAPPPIDYIVYARGSAAGERRPG